MKPLGRILVRPNNEIGVFVPINQNLKPGLYNLVEIMGEVVLQATEGFIGSEDHLKGLSPNDIISNREQYLLTKSELKLLHEQYNGNNSEQSQI